MMDVPTGPRPSPGKQEGLVLIPHPDALPTAEIVVAVAVERPTETRLRLRYVVEGEVGKLRSLELGHGARIDGLWQTTCFEAFVQTGEGDEYWELNFSPTTDWAGYRFDRYRDGMRPAAVAASIDLGPDHLYAMVMLTAEVDISQTPQLANARILYLGLSAVIEEEAGTKSYWALAHAPGPPDFHNRDCFTARLAAPNGP
jgi:hypothetical protein